MSSAKLKGAIAITCNPKTMGKGPEREFFIGAIRKMDDSFIQMNFMPIPEMSCEFYRRDSSGSE
jgi:hypothetical protein